MGLAIERVEEQSPVYHPAGVGRKDGRRDLVRSLEKGGWGDGQIFARLCHPHDSTVAQRDVSSATVHAHARAVRAFLRFAYEEDWIEEPVTVRMPRLEQKRMEVLSREDVKRILRVCGTRDRALVMTLIDSGLRRGEALALNWDDVDFRTGAIHVRRGKGGKARVTYVGAKTRRALLRVWA